MITEDYVSFETAKLLKKKGFKGLCNAYYDCFTTDNFHSSSEPTDFNSIDTKIRNIVSAPTLQMAMKWLREVHKLYVEVYIVKNYNNKTVEYCITIEDLNFPGSDDGFEIGPSHKSYEEACEAAIKYCLKHLIW